MKVIKCNPGDLDGMKNSDEYEFLYFTVRNGKAKYHMLHLPDRSCGIYYALRVTPEGLEGKRALEPLDEINCYMKKKV